MYYDREEPSYSTIVALLNEYRYTNPRISIETIDYLREAGAAQRVKGQYQASFPSTTNVVIFDCEGRVKTVDGNVLTQYTLEAVPNEKQREFRKKPVAFQGEKMFTGALLAVTSSKPLNAYFLQGHKEHRLDDTDEMEGYQKFADVEKRTTFFLAPSHLLVPTRCRSIATCSSLRARGKRSPTKNFKKSIAT